HRGARDLAGATRRARSRDARRARRRRPSRSPAGDAGARRPTPGRLRRLPRELPVRPSGRSPLSPSLLFRFLGAISLAEEPAHRYDELRRPLFAGALLEIRVEVDRPVRELAV